MTVTILSHPSHLCYIRQAWADVWVEAPLLEACSIQSSAAPSHSTAMFFYRYGRGMAPAIGARAADSAPATIARPDILGWYVRVDITGLGSWWGIITDRDDKQDGLWGGTVQSGQQSFTAFGLTWLLEQAEPLRQSKIKTSAGVRTINRALPFNGGTDGGRNRNSRVSWKNYDTADKCFTSQQETPAPLAWKAAAAVSYILESFPPKNSAGVVLVPFGLAAGAEAFLDYEIPQVDYHGENRWVLLNRLIDRRRALGWHAYVDVGTNSVKLKVWSQNTSDITLSASTVPANPDTMAYNFETALNITAADVVTTLQVYFDQVIVEGERIGAVFTVRPGTNFEPDWTTAEKNGYNAGATAQTGYSSLSDENKAAANADARALDSLAPVFSWWKLKDDWNGRGDTDPTSGSVGFAFPVLSPDGVPDLATCGEYYQAGLRIEPYIPLRAGVSYAADVTPATGAADGREADFLPPIVLFLVPPANAGDAADKGWIHAERLNEGLATGSSLRPFTYAVDVLVRDDAPGLVLRTAGVSQHFIAEELFVAAGSYDSVPGVEGIDSTKWLGTVYMQGDDFCQGVWPLTAALTDLDLVRKLRLKIPGAHLDFLLANTVVGSHFGAAVINTAGGLLRDDRDRLKDIAKLAHKWYGTQRRTLSLSFKALVSGFEIGTLITTIGSGATLETINTVITSVRFDLRSGMTTVSTQFGELDFTL